MQITGPTDSLYFNYCFDQYKLLIDYISEIKFDYCDLAVQITFTAMVETMDGTIYINQCT